MTGLTNGQSYTFTVTASNADGTGAASAASNAVVPVTVPDAPTGVSATAGNSSASVSWTAAGDEGSPITGYTVSDGVGDTCSTPDGSTTSCTVSGLANGTSYAFTVQATNANGAGEASAASNSVTPSTVPDAPTGVSATSGDQSATVSWTAPFAEGSPITGYTVSDGVGDTCSTPDGSTTSCTVTGLTPLTAYTFTVTATNADGTGAASAASNSVTPSTVPDAPTGVSAAPGNRSATVSWTAPSAEGSPITGYTVSDGVGDTCSTPDGSTTSCTVSGLTNGESYSFTVTATNADGTGAASAASTGVTPSTVPDAPTGVSATGGHASATVSWTAPSDEGSPITGYTASDGVGQTCSTSGTSCTVAGLTNGHSYTFTVTATNADGTGAASAASTSVTPSTVPDAPTGVSAAPGNRSATVSWTAPSAEGSPITGYSVSDGVGDTCSTPDGSTTSCTVSGLTNGESYSFTVTATNADGTGAASAASTGVTPSTVPDAPTGVSATAGNASATVSWTAPSDEGSPITSYTALSSSGKTCVTASTSCTVTGLANDVAVSFTVVARNADGIGAASASSNSVIPSSNSATITSAASMSLAAGKHMQVTITTGGTPKATLSATGLPSWVSFTPGTGRKAGTAALWAMGPAAGGTFSLTIHANNGVGPDTTQVFTIHVLAITSSATANFTKGTPGSFTVRTSGGSAAVALSATISSHLGGLTFHDNGDGTGTLSGTPRSTAKTTNVKVTATSGSVTVTQTLQVIIG